MEELITRHLAGIGRHEYEPKMAFVVEGGRANVESSLGEQTVADGELVGTLDPEAADVAFRFVRTADSRLGRERRVEVDPAT